MAQKKSVARRKKAVLVLGAPRSGTSAVSHLLQQLGVDFGDERNFVDAAIHTHNPIFFELAKLNALNEKVFARQGHFYGDVDFFPSADQELDVDQALVDEAQTLIRQEFGSKATIGLKDPRFCFTLPFWRHVLDGLGYNIRYVLTLRDRRAIVESNGKVNCEDEFFNRRLAWLSMAAAAVHLDGHQFETVEYDQLVEDPAEVAERLVLGLNLHASADVQRAGEVIRANLRHEQSDARGRKHKTFDISVAAREYSALRETLQSHGVLALLDQYRIRIRQLETEIAAQSQRASESQGTAGISASMRYLVEKVDWQSHAIAEYGEHLRAQVNFNRSAQEQLHGEIARLTTLHADAARQAGEIEQQLQAEISRLQEELRTLGERPAGGSGDEMPALAKTVGGSIQHLVEQVDWQSHAMVQYGDHVRALVESNRRAQEQLHEEIANLTALHAETVRQGADKEQLHQSEISRLQQELRSLGEAAEAAKVDVRASQSRFDELRGESERALASSEGARQTLQSELDRAKHEIVSLHDDRSRSARIIEERETALAAANVRISTLERELRSDRERHQAAVQALHAELQNMRDSLALEARHAEQVTDQLADREKSLHAAEARVAEFEREISVQRMEFNAQRQSFRSELDRLDTDLETALEKISRADQELLTRNKVIEELDSAYKILGARVAAAESARKQAERRASKLLDQVDSLTERCKEVQQQLDAERKVVGVFRWGALPRWRRQSREKS